MDFGIFDTMKRYLIVFLFSSPMLVAASYFFVQDIVYRDASYMLDENEWVESTLKNLSLDEKIAQLMMPAMYPELDENHKNELKELVRTNRIGGIICFQGKKAQIKDLIQEFQQISEVPLLVAIDGEWGVSMRLSDADRYPYAYTLGAAGDPSLTKKTGELIAQECRELGIHMNFAPLADVNSNPDNPVIGFRSFGEFPREVGIHVAAMVEGMESQGVLSCLKHFPGHGDTDVDSHLDLPVVNNTREHIEAIDFSPFRTGIRSGASSVMMGHLNVPALDPSGTPSSLSPVIIQKYLRTELGFSGLIISDALGMKAVSDRYGKVDVAVKAFLAGCDLLLMPEDVKGTIEGIRSLVNRGDVSEEDINKRCRRVLRAKYKAIIAPPKLKSYTEGEQKLYRRKVYEKAVTVLVNKDETLPIKDLSRPILLVSIGPKPDDLLRSIKLHTSLKHFNFPNGTEAAEALGGKLTDYSRVITTVHATSLRPADNFSIPPDLGKWTEVLPNDIPNILVLFTNPLLIRHNKELTTRFKSVILAYENNPELQNRVGQLLMGSIPAGGRLPFLISPDFPRGHGLSLPSIGRLKDSQPEELGINPESLAGIDSIAERGIKEKAFPGCQILVAIEGKVIYRKSFGHHTYEGDRAVQNTDLYDIASVTKIAGSTLALMKLESERKFDLNATLESYLPELTKNTSYASVQIRSMMAHQAGFTPWIPFYKKTLQDGKPDPSIYSKSQKNDYSLPVTESLYLKNTYPDQIYQQLLQTPRSEKGYKYSDLGYYFLKRIIEKQSGMALDAYLQDELYAPLGLSRMLYNPWKRFSLNEIVPTENDMAFRGQQIHGYVHDQGAAMLGGVGGHAGLFANAGDLAAIMQLFLNKGAYGGQIFISEEVVDRYTACQFCPGNRRAAGFDKPVLSGNGGPTCELVSKASFGHSGFTGTLAWADPVHKINYVFLSNRVYPDAENWKIVNLNIRTDIQRVIYQALLASKQ